MASQKDHNGPPDNLPANTDNGGGDLKHVDITLAELIARVNPTGALIHQGVRDLLAESEEAMPKAFSHLTKMFRGKDSRGTYEETWELEEET